MKSLLKSLTVVEWLIWTVSAAAITASFFIFENDRYHYLVGAVIGVTALVFVSKGNPLGQLLTVVFSVFYGVISYSFGYYGEMITYLAMTSPMAVAAFVSWIRNPYKGNKQEVSVGKLSKKERALFALASVAVTVAFYFILRALHTSNLTISTVSVFSSFIASYLTARRSRFYAVGYALNDLILIVMWSLASAQDAFYVPMIVCFSAFFALDVYGFVNWSKINKKQNSEKNSSND